MAMPQRDNLIDGIVKTDAPASNAVMHRETEEAERLRAKLRQLAAMGDGCEVTSYTWDETSTRCLT